jgi:hypothetical protein
VASDSRGRKAYAGTSIQARRERTCHPAHGPPQAGRSRGATMTSTLANYRTQNSKSFVLFALQLLCKIGFKALSNQLLPANNFRQQKLLCKVSASSLVDLPTNTHSLHILSAFAVSSTAMIPKNPLRLIVARTPIFYDLYNQATDQLCWFLDTLECGHQQMTLNLDVPDIGRTRHRCGECAQAAALKKPAASVAAPQLNRRAA